MSLSDLNIDTTYRTSRHDLVNDFFVPCLEAASLYRRASGYFTSNSLAEVARGVASLVARKGKMQLVASPHLTQEDIKALNLAQNEPNQVLKAVAARSMEEIEDALTKDRLNMLSWLAATGLLEIRLAIRLWPASKSWPNLSEKFVGT